MKSVYAYYRVDPAQMELAAGRIDALLNAMAPHCGATPRRLNRCDDAAMWMEIYEGIADLPTFSAALRAAAQNAGCAAFIQGERHLECFVTHKAMQ